MSHKQETPLSSSKRPKNQTPQHFLYFFPRPQEHGSWRPFLPTGGTDGMKDLVWISVLFMAFLSQVIL